jgi:hypothetical protein
MSKERRDLMMPRNRCRNIVMLAQAPDSKGRAEFLVGTPAVFIGLYGKGDLCRCPPQSAMSDEVISVLEHQRER